MSFGVGVLLYIAGTILVAVCLTAIPGPGGGGGTPSGAGHGHGGH
jgi:hypothetical protein